MDFVQQLNELKGQLTKLITEKSQEDLQKALAQIESMHANAIALSKEVKLSAVLSDPDLTYCEVVKLPPDICRGIMANNRSLYATIRSGDWERMVPHYPDNYIPLPEQVKNTTKIVVMMFKDPA